MSWILIVVGFALGSVPFGFMIAKAKGIDIRQEGSGNIGATNVMRVLGKGPGILVFVLDVIKGFVPALCGHLLFHDVQIAFAAGVAAVFGHTFSPFLKFKGGKGIATGLGALLGSSPFVGLAAFSIFFVGMGMTMMVSVASILAAISLPIFGWLLKDPLTLVGGYAAMAVFIIYKHLANLKRVRLGTEPVLGQKPGEPRPSLAKGRIISLVLALTFGSVVIVNALNATR